MLAQRLRGRSKDSESDIQRRLEVARQEVASFAEYDFIVVNDEIDAAVDRLQVTGSMSMNTGVAPTRATQLPVAKKE